MSKESDKMYVLVDEESGGVYTVWDDASKERIVQMFLAKDDAIRYHGLLEACLLYTSPSPRDQRGSRMPSSA